MRADRDTHRLRMLMRAIRRDLDRGWVERERNSFRSSASLLSPLQHINMKSRARGEAAVLRMQARRS